MAPGSLTKQNRKLAEKIDGRDVYARELVNDDLDAIDVLGDEYAEVGRQIDDLREQVKLADDTDERKDLRAQIRTLTHEQRDLDTQMLGLYVEDKDGQCFEHDILTKTPVRVQTALFTAANKLIYGGDEGPTPGTTATA